MGIEEYSIGDIVACPTCYKEFEINSDDDFDNYFYHITTCDPADKDEET